MPYIQARAKYTGGNGKVVTMDSNSLNVIKNIPLSEWIIRVEASPIGTSNVATRTHFELSEPVVVPHNSFVQIFPILRSEINKTQTGEGFHLAALRFTDTLVNGRSVKTIAYNEIFGTWKFATNILNIVSLNTDGTTYGTSPINAVFNTYGMNIACTIIKDAPPMLVGNTANYYRTPTGGSPYPDSSSTATFYLRFKLSAIKAGTVVTLRAGTHGTPRGAYYTDFTVIQANGAVDSSNGIRTRMYGEGVPNKTITLTFTKGVVDPVEFIIGVNIYNYIYQMDKYGTYCNNYVDVDGVEVLKAYASLSWG